MTTFSFVTLVGIGLVMLAGLGTGTVAWPMKKMRRLQFENYWFIGMLVGLVLIPWAVVLTAVPGALEAYAGVGWPTLLKANLCAFCWGIANVLYGICVVRIGAALTGAILTGLGVIVGTTLPMVLKGTGLFQHSPDIASPSGKVILAGLAVMLGGVVISSLAGFGRDRALNKDEQAAGKPRSGGFLGGLMMTIIAGITSAGIALSFVYGQGPIVEAMKAKGAGDMTANIAVWAAALQGGALVNLVFPAYLMTKKKTWGLLLGNGSDVMLAIILGAQFILSVILMGRGMLLLGALGASVGIGIQQAMQIIGNQGVGFFSGEWRGIFGKPRLLMYASVGVLILAVIVMAYSNTLPN